MESGTRLILVGAYRFLNRRFFWRFFCFRVPMIFRSAGYRKPMSRAVCCPLYRGALALWATKGSMRGLFGECFPVPWRASFSRFFRDADLLMPFPPSFWQLRGKVYGIKRGCQ
jgi:hypothetical protein